MNIIQLILKPVLIFLFFLPSSLCFSQVVEEWVKRYNGLANRNEVAASLIVDDSGYIYVIGGSQENNIEGTSSLDFVTIKYNTSGKQIWAKNYNGPGSGDDIASSIAVDKNGNVYVTGQSYNSVTNDLEYSSDYATIKYDSQGNEVWVKRHNGFSGEDKPSSVAVDVSGNVYVTGGSKNSERNRDYATIKYDTNGKEIWLRRYNGALNYEDESHSLAVDVLGNSYVTGTSDGDYTTIKYNAFGNEVWIKRYNGPANAFDRANSIRVDADGNTYVTGLSFSETYLDIATIKYDLLGNEVWVARHERGEGNSLVVDKNGNVYVTGTILDNTGRSDFITIKYNSSGIEQWAKTYNGPANDNDQPLSMANDTYGNVYVTGISYGVDSSAYFNSSDYVTIKYDAAGNAVWIKKYSGPGNYMDEARSIGVDVQGNVYVAGVIQNSDLSFDFATIKYSQTSSANHPPTVTVQYDFAKDTLCQNDLIEIQFLGKDLDEDILTYRIEGELPTGLNLNSKTGLVSGNLPGAKPEGSELSFKVIVTDLAGAEDTVFFNKRYYPCDYSRFTNFSLIDAITNASLGALTEDDTLDLSILPAKISVRANLISGKPHPIKSVVFTFNEIKNFQTENIAPYSLGGDINGKYSPVNLKLGTNNLTATGYSLFNGKGTAVAKHSITINVIRSSGNHSPKIVSINTKEVYCRGDYVSIKTNAEDTDGDKLTFSIDSRGDSLPNNLSLNTETGEINGVLVRTGDEGSSTGYGVIVKATDARGLSAIAFANIFSVDCGLRVTSFTLVDVSTKKDIQDFLPGQAVDLVNIPPKASIRANVYSDDVIDSVIFDFNGSKKYRIETIVPYALNGDINGNYRAANFIKGVNTISARPFFKATTAEKPFSITLNLKCLASNSETTARSTSSENLHGKDRKSSEKKAEFRVSPNPFTSQLILQLSSFNSGPATITLYNSLGQLVHTKQIPISSGTQSLTIKGSEIPKGIYLLQIISNGKRIGNSLRVVRE